MDQPLIALAQPTHRIVLAQPRRALVVRDWDPAAGGSSERPTERSEADSIAHVERSLNEKLDVIASQHDDRVAYLQLGALIDEAEHTLPPSRKTIFFDALPSHASRFAPEKWRKMTWHHVASRRGDAEAQFFSGTAYYELSKIKPELAAKAIVLWQAAERQDYPLAVRRMSLVYLNGEHESDESGRRRPDPARAQAARYHAADLGEPEALTDYATRKLDTARTEHDIHDGLQHLRDADQRYREPRARWALAQLHENGRLGHYVPRDTKVAFDLFRSLEEDSGRYPQLGARAALEVALKYATGRDGYPAYDPAEARRRLEPLQEAGSMEAATALGALDLRESLHPEEAADLRRAELFADHVLSDLS